MIVLGVGSKVWIMEHEYGRDAYKWSPAKITGETRVSWIIGEHSWCQRKFPKKDVSGSFRRYAKRGTSDHPDCVRVAVSEEERDQISFVLEERSAISRLVGHVENPFILREIARLIDYKETA